MGKMFPHLCEPIEIGNLELKNRMICTPMVGLLSNEDGTINDRFREYYRQRGRDGFALVATEAFATRIESRIGRMASAAHPMKQIGIGDVANAIHEGGAKAAIQLAYRIAREI